MGPSASFLLPLLKQMEIKALHSVLDRFWEVASTNDGHSGNLTEQTQGLVRFVTALPPNARILEIGFNCGHSAATMLSTRPDITVLSLDLGSHEYVASAKQLIDQTFPGRHDLKLGDSVKTMHEVTGNFDMFFIDGGHEYNTALLDTQNCLTLARPSDLIVIDDVCSVPHASWTFGPSQVWREMLHTGCIRLAGQTDFSADRGWAWGYPTRIGSKAEDLQQQGAV